MLPNLVSGTTVTSISTDSNDPAHISPKETGKIDIFSEIYSFFIYKSFCFFIDFNHLILQLGRYHQFQRTQL